MVLPSSWIIVAFWIVAIVSTVVAFAIWLISRVILVLYIAIGPLLIGVALFPATRSIHERWIGALTGAYTVDLDSLVAALTPEQRALMAARLNAPKSASAAPTATPDGKTPGATGSPAFSNMNDSANLTRAGDRTRTGDVQLGKLAFYQLNYAREACTCA